MTAPDAPCGLETVSDPTPGQREHEMPRDPCAVADGVEAAVTGA